MNGLLLERNRPSIYHAKIISIFNIQLHFDCTFMSHPVWHSNLHAFWAIRRFCPAKPGKIISVHGVSGAKLPSTQPVRPKSQFIKSIA
ncbi:hypothetical protein [Thalassospira marina]|uniref:hypothetical protein n=1 Tax=Thalassospira marina TaxID=2048283 RepID=UPI0012FEEE07|nr:hypothetical protein [Thalassospira marina]